MSTFTITLSEAIEITGGTIEIANGFTTFTPGDSELGLMHYPIWEESYRNTLNGKIVDHYWNREIGMETIDLFQLAMRRKMNEIMPVYNQLYASTKLAFDPMSTVDLTTISDQTANQVTNNTGTSQTDTDSDASSRSVQSNTPQTMLAGNEDYATGAVDANSQSSGTSNASEDSSSDTDAESHNQTTVKGYQGLPSELLMQYRQTILNIDLSIINDLSELFMQVWDNGDSYTQSPYTIMPFYGFQLGRMYP